MRSLKWITTPLLLLVSVFCLPVLSEDLRKEIDSLKERLLSLEEQLKEEQEKQEALADEVQETKLSQMLPSTAPLKSQWGMGPAASRVYGVSQGVSISGYGEANYRNFVNDAGGKKDQAEFLRMVTYLGYRFNDWLLFNSEIEFEHGTTDGIGGTSGDEAGEVSVEFAYLDFLTMPEFNVRAGMVLMPVGFINEIHESPYYHGNLRPEVEQKILPSTWREMGVGVFGRIGNEFQYRTYLTNGLRASRFSSSGIREGRQNGNKALAEGFASVTRLDYTPDYLPGTTFGGSFYIGESGQDEDFAGSTPSVLTTIYEVHAQYQRHGFELRALGAWVDIDDADILSMALSDTIASQQNGWYLEAAYNVLPMLGYAGEQALLPFVRYESLDTQASVPAGFVRNASLDRDVRTYGLTYRPIPRVAVKLDYRDYTTDGPAKIPDEITLGIGFAL